MKKGIYRECKICQEKTYVFRSLIKTNRGKYCSKKCMYKGISQDRKGKRPKNYLLFKSKLKEYERIYGKYKKIRTKGKYRNCRICKKKFYALPAQVKRDCGFYCTKKCYHIYRKSIDSSSNLGIYGRKGSPTPKMAFKPNDPRITGRNNNNWKGGITELSFQIRHSYIYNQWRKKVFERDNYTCQICGENNCYINADHIKPFSVILKQNNITTLLDSMNCMELWNLNNGRTLCVACHSQTETYLKGRQPIWN